MENGVDQECFYTPAYSPREGLVVEEENFHTSAYRHRASSMLEEGFHMPMVPENGLGHGGENGDFKFLELKDEQVNGGEAVEGENGDVHTQESIEEQMDGLNLESEEIDVAVDGEIGDHCNLEREAVMPEKMNKDQILEGGLYVPEKIDGVVDAQVNAECRGEEVVGVEEQREDLSGDRREAQVESIDSKADMLTMNEGEGALENGHDRAENGNGDIVEAVNTVAEADQGVQEALNGSVRSDGLPNGQAALVGHSETGSGSNAKSYASVLKQGLSEEPRKKTEGKGSSSVSTPETVNDVTETEQGVLGVLNGSVGSDSLLNGQAAWAVHSETSSGSNAKSYASVVKQGLSEEPKKKTEGEGSSSVSTPETVNNIAETDQGVQGVVNGSVGSDSLLNGQAARAIHSETGSGSNAKSYDSVVKQGLSEEPKKKTDGEGSSSVSIPETVNNVTKTDQGVQGVVNGSVGFDSLLNGQAARAINSETGNGSSGKSYASVVKQGLSEEPKRKTVEEGSSSVSMTETVENHVRESILVKDLGESSLMNNDNNGSLSQAVMSSASCIGSSPGPPPAADLGSSSGRMLEIIEECDRDSVLVEAVGESSSTDNDKNGSSSQATKPSVSHMGNSAGPSLPPRPAGLGSSAPLLEPAARSVQQRRVNGVHQQRPQPPEEPVNDDPEENENDETRKKLQDIRVKFLRLAHRLGQTPHNVVVAQVLYRIGLAEQLRKNTNRVGVFSFDQASVMAEQLEAAGKDLDDFTCTILMIGKAGVGKSATINSILDEHEGTMRVYTDAFQSGTKTVQVIQGRVQRINVRVIDTPGLFTCSMDQQHNVKILNSIKKVIRKTPPDIVLYFDRLDMQSRDFGDVPLLRSITDIFGTSIWFNAIVVLTHAASAPPDGSNGIPLSYEMFVTQRSHVVQQAIRQAAGDVRLMNPVSLVENHSACRTNRNGQRVLPNGQVWKLQLLLLSFASKVLAEANILLKLQDSPPNIRQARLPPLPALLSSLLQSRPQLKLPEEQYSDDDAAIDDLDQTSDSDEGADYDELPPFKHLNKAQMGKLTKQQKKAYFEELEYREKLFSKKQLKEDRKYRKLMRNMAEAAKDLPNGYNGENLEDDSSSPASVPVALPDLVLPTSFDSDNPTHRYRFLETSNQWVVRPVLETQGWDHDIGYEGLNLERLFVVKDKVPVSVSGQLTKDKKECTIQMEFASSIKHSETGATSLGLDMQTVGKNLAYTLRGETRVKNFRRNNTAAGVSVTLLGDAMSAGVKIEDKLVVTKRLRLLMSGGAVTGRGDIAYGGHLEATLRDKDYPIGRTLSTLALSVVDWHGDLATGCNIQSQFPFGRGTNVIGHANLSNRGTGQVGIRLNSSDHMQIALLALFPIFKSLERFLVDSSQPM